MANPVSAQLNAKGKVVITYDDESTRVVSVAEAKKMGLDVSKVEKDSANPGGYGGASGAFGDTVVDPVTGQSIQGTLTVPTKEGVKSLTDLVMAARDPKQLGKIRSALIANGLLTKGTRSLTTIQNAYTNVLAGAATAQMDPFDYMAQLKAQGFGQDVAAAPEPYGQSVVYTPEKAQSFVTTLVSNLLHRQPTAEEITKYSDDIIKQQSNPKNASTTTYKTVNGRRIATTTTGFDAEQYLTNKIAKLPEYKTIQENLNSASAQKLKSLAAANDVALTEDQLADWGKRISAGESPDVFAAIIRDQAALGQPDSVKNLLTKGVDLAAIYDPYKRIMAQTLEINPETITLDDPVLRSAIGPDKEMSLYEYKRALRKDPRWQYTDQARSDAADVATTVLKDFGFMG